MAEIQFARPDGEKAKGYLATPSGEARGGVVVIQEWWGLTDQIRAICDRLAKEGYRALAPDLYDGVVVPYGKPDEASAKLNALDFPGAVNQYVRGAVQHLKAEGGKVAVLGFCMGGAITLLSSAMVPEADAAVCYYGIPPGFEPKNIKTPLLAHFAKQDDWCTPANVDKFEEALKAAGKEYELYRYDAQHAFANDKRPEVHDAVKAEQAWDRSIVFLRQQIG
jgi:carboxymethylenebutenolidase